MTFKTRQHRLMPKINQPSWDYLEMIDSNFLDKIRNKYLLIRKKSR